MISGIQGKILFVGTGAFALGILYGTFSHLSREYMLLSVFIGILCLFLGIFESEHRSKSTLYFVAIGAGLLMFPLGEVRAALAPLPSAYVPLLNTPISLMGTIVADPDIRAKNQQLLVEVNKDGQRTNILAFAPLFQHFNFGEHLLIAGTLTAPTPFATDSGHIFRYDNFLAKKDVFALVPQADILEVSPPEGMVSYIANGLFAIKHIFVKGLARALPDPFSELATGLLTGDQHGLGDTIVMLLTLSGLIWVVVLSGYHVTLIAGGILKLFSIFPKRFAFMCAGIAVLAIIFATGASAPSLRGGAMACLTLYARATNRAYDAIRALCMALIVILLWNPFLLAYDAGFQLSLVVTPALIIATPLLEMRLLWIKSEIVRESIAVSTIAQLACMPLILWQTGQLSPWAIPANIFVMSLVPLAMFVSVAAGVAGVVIPALASLAGLPAFGVLYYILFVAKVSTVLPYANATLPPFPFAGVVFMYGFLIEAVVWLKRRTPASKAAGVLHGYPQAILLTPLHSKTFSQ